MGCVSAPVRFLKAGVFDVQNLITIPHAKLLRKLIDWVLWLSPKLAKSKPSYRHSRQRFVTIELIPSMDFERFKLMLGQSPLSLNSAIVDSKENNITVDRLTMTYSTSKVNPQTSSPDWSEDSQIWQSLKSAIAASSGFQRWQLEQQTVESFQGLSLDQQVQRYLRETLETLAY